MLSLFPAIDRLSKESSEGDIFGQESQHTLSRGDSQVSLSLENDDLEGNEGGLREQDRLLPVANIVRTMKRILPENAKISREARDLVQEAASEFIMFIASEASEYGLLEKRRTMVAEDILRALENLGMDPYVEPMRCFLMKHRQLSRVERPAMTSGLALGGHDQ
jgi:nuclear transcription Y subunit beta